MESKNCRLQWMSNTFHWADWDWPEFQVFQLYLFVLLLHVFWKSFKVGSYVLWIKLRGWGGRMVGFSVLIPLKRWGGRVHIQKWNEIAWLRSMPCNLIVWLGRGLPGNGLLTDILDLDWWQKADEDAEHICFIQFQRLSFSDRLLWLSFWADLETTDRCFGNAMPAYLA